MQKNMQHNILPMDMLPETKELINNNSDKVSKAITLLKYHIKFGGEQYHNDACDIFKDILVSNGYRGRGFSQVGDELGDYIRNSAEGILF